jgi:uncharacterized protein (DUF433 family)
MELNIELPGFLTRRPDGEIVVTGTRVTLYCLESSYRDYDSFPLLQEHFPHIPMATLVAVIGFCDEHRAEYEPYRADYQATLDKQYEEGDKVDLAELRGRLVSRRLPAA